MSGKKYGFSSTANRSVLEQIDQRLRMLIGNDISRVFEIDGFLIKEVSPGGDGIVNRLYLKCIFFNDDGHICGDFQTLRHDGDGFIWGRELGFLNSEDLKRILGLLNSFPLAGADDKAMGSRRYVPSFISNLVRMPKRYLPVSRHV